MRIFVLRHGHAEPQRTTDEARNLTALGRSQVELNLRNSLDDLVGIDTIWASPLVRAQQTAAIAHNLLKQNSNVPPVQTKELIVPEADIYAAFDALQKLQRRAVLLVSHQPFVGHFLDVLCGRENGFHSMNTSSLAAIDCDLVAAGLGQLLWLRHVNG